MTVVPRKAAACILLRGAADRPEVLLARRSKTMKFMGGQYVFPGGRIDDDESTQFVVDAPDVEWARAVHAVAREVFEETGLICARGPLPDRASLRTAREALLRHEAAFDDILESFGLHIHASEFEPAGTWVTPKFSPIRFDTRYLLHRVRDDHAEELIEGEMIALDWFHPADARRRWHLGEIVIPTPVAFALQQLAAKPYPEVVPYLSRATERAPGEHSRFEIRRGITVIPLETATILPATHTNCVVIGEDELLVIDPGSDIPHELNHLKYQLDHLIDLGGRIAAIILTHSHPDHTAGVPFVREHYGAPVWAHEATARQIAMPVDRFIEDGEVLVSAGDPEWRLRAFHTPGHDPGHLCFLEESTASIIAGDMVANPGTIVVSEEYGGSMNEFIASLERMIEVHGKLLIPSHGLVLPKPAEAFKQHLDHRLWREDKIRKAWEGGARSIDALIATAYDDAPAAALPLARHALKAHLSRLGFAAES